MPRMIHTLAHVCAAVTAAAAVVLPAGPVPAAGRVHALGALPSSVTIAANLGASASAVVPAGVDLRAGAPPVGDQGQVGSCVAWSIGYSLTGYYAHTVGNNGAPYAALYLYMRTVQGKPGPTGLYPAAALRNEQNEGIDTQADYWQGTTNVTRRPTTAQIKNAARYRITGWTTLFSGVQSGTTAQTVLKRSLAAGTPVSISIPVYSAFDRIASMKPYSNTTGRIRGYHMITAYGYDRQGLIIRNSWGRWWGSAGDAELAWSFVNRHVGSAYTISGVRANGKASLDSPTITRLSATKSAAGRTITITGKHLASVRHVRFGSVPAEFTNITTAKGTALAVVVPPHAPGTVDVTVTNRVGTSRASAAGRFTYLPRAATKTAIRSPSM